MKIREKWPSDHEIADEIGQRTELMDAMGNREIILMSILDNA